MTTDPPGHLPGMSPDPAIPSANSASDELSDTVESGFFREAYYEWLEPVLHDNAGLTSVLTIVGICLIAFQVVVLFRTLSKKGIVGALLAPPLLGGILMSLMLIAPTVVMPMMLGGVDTVIGVLVSIFSRAG